MSSRQNTPSCTTVGDRVKIRHQSKSKDVVGTVRFIGEINGKSGIHYGVELNAATGDNSGSYKQVSYFKTTKKHGVFVSQKSILKTNTKNNATAPRVTVGSKVHVTKVDCTGIIRYIGEPEFKSGIWYGIQLEEAKGKNNGTVKGRSYFECKGKFGSFVKANGFTLIPSKHSNHSNNSKDSNHSNLSNHFNHKQSTSVIERRKDLEKVINVLNDNGSSNDIDHVIASYDDRKESEDQQWLKLIVTLKAINDKLIANNSSTARSKDDTAKYIAQIEGLKADKSALESEVSTLKLQKNQNGNGGNGKNGMTVPSPSENKQFERRLKFEIDQIRTKYESQIRTLKADKQRLEAQVASNESNSSTLKQDNDQIASSKMSEISQSDNDSNEMVKQLQVDLEQSKSTIRSKDSIIDRLKRDVAKLQKEIGALKEEEEKEELQLDSLQKDRARKLLQERVEDQQQNALNAGPEQKKQTLSEMLNESTKEDAISIIHSMNCIKFEYDKKLKRDTYNLDLTNNSVLRRLTDVQRKKFMFLLAHCICDSSGQQKVEKVRMSNMNIDDKVFPDFMAVIVDNVEHFGVEEWALESNKIGNEGMKMFAAFLEMSPPTLEEVKMYNNKTSVSTSVLNDLLSSIEKNDKICKFTFEWRLTQHRDRIDKQLRKNQDLRRKAKWANKK